MLAFSCSTCCLVAARSRDQATGSIASGRARRARSPRPPRQAPPLPRSARLLEPASRPQLAGALGGADVACNDEKPSNGAAIAIMRLRPVAIALPGGGAHRAHQREQRTPRRSGQPICRASSPHERRGKSCRPSAPRLARPRQRKSPTPARAGSARAGACRSASARAASTTSGSNTNMSCGSVCLAVSVDCIGYPHPMYRRACPLRQTSAAFDQSKAASGEVGAINGNRRELTATRVRLQSSRS